MLEFFYFSDHYCSTCDCWQGPRIMSECEHVHTLAEALGSCLKDNIRMTVSDFCANWSQWQTAS